MIEPDLRKWILSHNDVVSRLEGSGLEPVFIDEAEPNSGEYILIRSEAEDFLNTMDADDSAHHGTIAEDISIDVKCETVTHAKLVGRELLNKLFPKGEDNFSGLMGDRNVEAMYLESVSSGIEPPRRGESMGRKLMQIALRIEHSGANE